MEKSQKDILFESFRVTEYVIDLNGTIGFEDKTDHTAIWFRPIRGTYYFDGRLPLKSLAGNMKFKTKE